MKIIIFGGSGLIGQALVKHLVAEHEIAVVGRDVRKLKDCFGNTVNPMTWRAITTNVLANYDVAINLAGENIGAKRWTSTQKQKIINSRVSTTTKIAQKCAELAERAPRLMNASAVGVYGLQTTIAAQNRVIYDEDSVLPSPPSDFLSQVGCEWECALVPAEKAGVSVVKLRFAVVLSKHGGALVKMLPSFQLGLGAVLGSGQQPFSWVALNDVVAAITFLIHHPQASGAFNIVADEIVTQKIFAKTLAKVLKKPCFLRIPSPMVHLLFGQMGDELLLNGQRVNAKRLRKLGFEFGYPSLEAALSL